MKVRLAVDVDERQRFVIAKYFKDARNRATREQVRAFVAGALVSAVREQADALRPRQRKTAVRLGAGKPEQLALREPDEKQSTRL